MSGLDDTKLLKQAVSAAGSAAGGKVGAAAGDALLNFIGIETDALAGVRSDLSEIKTTLARIETTLAKMRAETGWIFTIASFKDLLASAEGPYDNVTTLVANTNADAARNSAVQSYLSGVDPQPIERDYNRFVDDALGKSSLFGNGLTLPQKMYRDKWGALFADHYLDDAADRSMAVCYRLTELMFRTGLLIYNIRAAKGQRSVGAGFLRKISSDMAALHREFITRAPSMLAYAMSGYPEAAGKGGGHHLSISSTQAGIANPHLEPSKMIYVNKRAGSNMSGQRHEIAAMTDSLSPLAFRFLTPDRSTALTLETRSVMTHPGRDSYQSNWGAAQGNQWTDEVPPKFTDLSCAVFKDPPDTPVASVYVARLKTTGQAGVYLIYHIGGFFMRADWYHETPSATAAATAGARSLNVAYATFGPTPDALSHWHVELQTGASGIYKAMFP